MNILIVNPFSSAEFLYNSFKQANIKTIALYTKSDLEIFIRPEKDWFNKQIFVDNADINTILNLIKNENIEFVLNGCESYSSGLVADQIAMLLKLNSYNNPKYTEYRTNKYKTNIILQQQQIPNVAQVKFRFGIDNIDNPSFKKINYPCFVKPLNGVSSYGVAKINSFIQLKDFFNNLDITDIKNRINSYLNEEILEYLICEYIDGDEYFIDTVSYQGNHYVSSIQKYKKKFLNNGKLIYRYIEISTNDLLNRKIISYTQKILNAVELNSGFAHTELMVKNGEPVLIELNQRVSGLRGAANYTAKLEGGETQPDILAKLLHNQDYRPTYISKEYPNYRILILLNLSTSPLPDLKIALKKYKIVHKVIQFKPIGYIHNVLPSAVADSVAVVICYSDNIDLLNQESTEILQHDEEGWS